MTRPGSEGGTVRWRAQDQEWRGANHGGNEIRCRNQKRERTAFVRFKCFGETSILVSYRHSGKAIVPSAVYMRHLGGVNW